MKIKNSYWYLMSILYMPNAFALNEASLDDSGLSLSVPVVQVGDKHYKAELSFLGDGQFSIHDLHEIAYSLPLSATYDVITHEIRFPVVRYMNKNYVATMALTNYPTCVVTSVDSANSGANLLRDWLINTSSTTSALLRENGSGIRVNVQSVAELASDTNFVEVKATGIPDYSFIVNEAILSTLTNRQKAASDFVNGSPAIKVGDTIQFGEDIGYNSNRNCAIGAGFGYWPPGPVCPTNQSHTGIFPKVAVATTKTCETGLSATGYALNGTSIYNWSDGGSYNNKGTWQTLAGISEQNDVDICGGHAANGDYHHHFYSECWAKTAGETATGHSPVYGYAADGYAIYGPWMNKGVLAKSCWKTREYTATSPTGCGSNGIRTCLLNDQYDITKGTVTTTNTGPTTSDAHKTMSSNVFTTASGYFFQDYYYDTACSAQGDGYLDANNGHDHDGLGYHYHLTVTDTNGSLTPVFPYTFGPRYHGTLQANAIAQCNSGVAIGSPGLPPPPL